MKLLNWGNDEVHPLWRVIEQKPCGYLRCYYIKGNGAMYHQGDTQTILKAGHIYLLPTTVPYQLTQLPGAPLDVLWFHFQTAPYLVSELKKLCIRAHPQLDKMLQVYAAELGRDTPDPEICEGVLSLVQMLLARAGVFQEIAPPFDDILQYIQAELSNPALSVGVLCQRIPCTPEHFIRAFSKAVGTTPYRYLFVQRMSLAQTLLRNKVKVKEVARQTGYENAQVFSYAFHKFFGISPREFERYYHPIA